MLQFSTACLLACFLSLPLQPHAQSSAGFVAAEASLTAVPTHPNSDDYHCTVQLALASLPSDSASDIRLTLLASKPLSTQIHIGYLVWHGGYDPEMGDTCLVQLSRNRLELTLTLERSSFVEVEPGIVACSFEASHTAIYPSGGLITLQDGIVELEVTIGVKAVASLLPSAASVGPNPTSDFLMVHGGAHAWDHLEVLDMQGQTLLTARTGAGRRLDVRFLPPGLYILRLHDVGGESQVIRFIKR